VKAPNQGVGKAPPQGRFADQGMEQAQAMPNFVAWGRSRRWSRISEVKPRKLTRRQKEPSLSSQDSRSLGVPGRNPRNLPSDGPLKPGTRLPQKPSAPTNGR